MPRIPPALLRHARAVDGLTTQLLPICRELSAAQNELRWLREHALANKQNVKSLVRRRARGEPLQYILGTEYFGKLEIKCRPGVLIPRQETAAAVTHLVQSHLPKTDRLRVLDLCTGTGCIPLLFHHEFYKKQTTYLDLIGVDISDTALMLAEENRQIQLANCHSNLARAALTGMQFIKADVMQDLVLPHHQFDVLISNPPYISRHDFKTVTARSVQQYEPRLALVPPTGSDTITDGDQFYPRLWSIADEVQAKVVLFEIGDAHQAERVAEMGAKHNWKHIELWRDEPNGQQEPDTCSTIGVGNVRSVFAKR